MRTGEVIAQFGLQHRLNHLLHDRLQQAVGVEQLQLALRGPGPRPLTQDRDRPGARQFHESHFRRTRYRGSASSINAEPDTLP